MDGTRTVALRAVLPLLALVVVLSAALPAAAQTRFSLQLGALVPFGSLEDHFDPSLTGALRLEIQPTNAIGQRRLVSVFGYLSFVDLVAKEEPDSGSQPSMVGAGGGLRFYSKHAPLFVGVGLGYLRLDPGGDADASGGFDLQANAGFFVPLWFFLAEIEATVHHVIDDPDDYQYATGTVGVAMPF